MARPRPLAARLRTQEGFGLVEVLVSALLVVVISLSVLGSLDAAGNASGEGKAKATAANLAQQDQERLQGMRPVDLMTLDVTQPVDVVTGDATVRYSVRSEGQYVLNPATGSGCTNGQRDEYLRIVSTVSWPGMRTNRPVRVESMIAPPLDAVAPTQGSAVLKLTRADGITPVVGQSVDLVGIRSGRQATGAEGCAFFANYPVGSYSFEFGSSGWVDPNGDEQVSLAMGITNQDVASLDSLYDQAGSVKDAVFVTYADGAVRGAKADRLDLAHPGVQRNAGVRSSTSTSLWTTAPFYGTASRASLDRLFPFVSPYAVYSGGQCGQALPASMRTLIAQGGGTVELKVTPQTEHTGLYVFEPALNPVVRYDGTGTYAARPGARVLVRSTDPQCPTPQEQTTDGAGKLPERGFPYGDYEVCAQYTEGGLRHSSGWQARRNDELYGLNWNLDVPKTGADKPCAV